MEFLTSGFKTIEYPGLRETWACIPDIYLAEDAIEPTWEQAARFFPAEVQALEYTDFVRFFIDEDGPFIAHLLSWPADRPRPVHVSEAPGQGEVHVVMDGPHEGNTWAVAAAHLPANLRGKEPVKRIDEWTDWPEEPFTGWVLRA